MFDRHLQKKRSQGSVSTRWRDPAQRDCQASDFEHRNRDEVHLRGHGMTHEYVGMYEANPAEPRYGIITSEL